MLALRLATLPALLLLVTSCRLELTESSRAGEVRARLAVASDVGKEPVSGAKLWLDATRLESRTDVKGRAIIRSIPPGTFTVRAALPDGSRALLIRNVSLDGAQALALGRDLGTLVLDAVGGIEGTVVEGGAPVVDAVVGSDRLAAVRTDAQGKFRIDKVPTGRHALHVSHGGSSAGPIEIDVERTKTATASIDLAALTPGKPGKIRGTIRQVGIDDRTGFRLDVFPFGSTTLAVTAVSDADGVFETDQVPGGFYDLIFTAPDASTLIVSPALVSGDAEFPTVVLAQTAATDDDDGDGVPNSAERRLSMPQAPPLSAAAGSTVPVSFFVQTLGGAPVAGEVLSVEVLGGGGSIVTAPTPTGADGRTSISFKLGPAAGANKFRVKASGAASIEIVIAGTSGSGPPAFLAPRLPGSVVASSTPLTLEIDARDRSGQLVVDFAGTVHIDCAGTGQEPLDFTFVPTRDFGSAKVPVVFRKAGVFTCEVTDVLLSLTGLTSQCSVSPAAASKFRVEPSVSAVPAGGAFSVTVTALDPFDNVAIAFAGAVSLSAKSGPSAPLPLASFTFPDLQTAGAHVFADLTLPSPGDYTLTATGPGAITGSGAISITTAGPAPLALRLLNAPPGGTTVLPGVPIAMTVQLLDGGDKVLPDGANAIVDVVFTDAAGAAPALLQFPAGETAERPLSITPRGLLPDGMAHQLKLKLRGSPPAEVKVQIDVDVAPPTITSAALGGGSGLVPITFALDHASKHAKVTATWAGAAAGSGTVAIGASSTGDSSGAGPLLARGTNHKLLWPADANGVSPGGVTVTLTAKAGLRSQQAVATATGTYEPTPKFVERAVGAAAAVTDVAVGDLDGDGLLDAVTITGGNTLNRHAGGAGGTFGAAVVVQATFPGPVRYVTLFDFDADGDLDLLITPATASELYLRLNTGGGTFASPVTIALSNHGTMSRPAAGYLDGDTYADLAVASPTGGRVCVLSGVAGGGFGSPLCYGLASPGPVLIADDDGDGDNELFIGDTLAPVLDRFTGSPFGVSNDFPSVVPLPQEITTGVTALAAADLSPHDPNRAETVVVAFAGAPTLRVVTPTGLEQVTSATSPTHLAFTDLDADGLLDLVAGAVSSRTIAVFQHRRDAQGPAYETAPTTVTLTGGLAGALVTGDVNADGSSDLVFARASPTQVGAFVSVPTIRPTPRFRWPTAINADPASLVLFFDHDGDGFDDVATLTPAGALLVARALGDGWFSPPVVVETNAAFVSLASADFDDDGRDDLVAGKSTGSCRKFVASGLLAFTASDVVTTGGDIVAAVDFSRDGLPDILAAKAGTGIVTIAASDAASSAVTLGPNLLDFMVTDVNGDGWRDLVGVNATSFFISLRVPGAGFATSTPSLIGAVSGLIRGAYDLSGAPSGSPGDMFLLEGTMLSLWEGTSEGLLDQLSSTGPLDDTRSGFWHDGTRELFIESASGGEPIRKAGQDLPAAPRFLSGRDNRAMGIAAGGFAAGGGLDVAFRDVPSGLVTLHRDADRTADETPKSLSFAPGLVASGFLRADGGPPDTGRAEQFIITKSGAPQFEVWGAGQGGASALQGSYAASAAVVAIAPGGADFNGDSWSDAVIGTTAGVELWQGGSSTWSPLQGPPLNAPVPSALAAGDVSGDGNADLLVAAAAGGQVTLLRGSGDGSFLSPVTFGIGPAAYDFVFVADVDHNHAGDVVLVRRGTTSQVSVFSWDGNGMQSRPAGSPSSFNVAAASEPFPSWPRPGESIALAGPQGVVVCGLSVVGCSPVHSRPLGAGSFIRAADLDGDGRFELVFGAGTAVDIVRSDGTFKPWGTLAFPSAVRDVVPIHTDGVIPWRPDLAVVTLAPSVIDLLSR